MSQSLHWKSGLITGDDQFRLHILLILGVSVGVKGLIFKMLASMGYAPVKTHFALMEEPVLSVAAIPWGLTPPSRLQRRPELYIYIIYIILMCT